MVITQIDQPALQNRYRIVFFKKKYIQETYDLTILSRNVVRFSFDTVARQFLLSFELPNQYPLEFDQLTSIIESFNMDILDGNNNITGTKTFKVKDFLTGNIVFDYSGNDVVELNVTGIYK